MPLAQRQKIAAALKGRKLTQIHKDNIKKSVQRFWDSIPQRPFDAENNNKEAEGGEI